MTLASLVFIAAVKGSVLLVVAWVVMRAWPRLSAALRHLVWASALGGLLLMPLLMRVVPTLRSRFVPAIPVVTSIETADLRRVPAAAPADPTTAAEHVLNSVAGVVAPPPLEVGPRSSIDLERWFPIAWAVVAFALLMRVGFGRFRLMLLARNASIVDDGEWLLLAQRLAYRLDISRPITLLRGDRSCVPMTWGLVYPTVLLPAEADEWTAERRTIVLLHELAHVNRLDAFTQLIAQIATAIFWFNPLAWFAARAMRVERELACDDCVLASGARPSDYAQDLLQIARSFSTRSDLAVAALAMARRGDLEERLLSILDPATDRRAVSRTRLIGATCGILALSVPLAALSPAPVEAAERSFHSVVANTPVASAPAEQESIAPAYQPVAPTAAGSRNVDRLLALAMADVQRIPTPTTNGLFKIPSAPSAHQPKVPAPISRAATPDRETLLSVAQAALKLTSAYDKAELLVPIAKYYLADDGLATAYITAAASITGDYDCSRAMNALFAGNAPLSDKTVELAMNAVATGIKSDYEKGRVIAATLGDERVLGPDARRAIIAAIATISASYDKRVAISTFVARRQFNEQDAIGLIDATTKITGNYDRAEALIDIATHHGLDDAGVRQAYVTATETIKSASDYRRAIEALVKRP